MTLEQRLDLLTLEVEKLKKKSVYQKKWLSTQEVSEITGYKISSLYQLNQKEKSPQGNQVRDYNGTEKALMNS